MRTPGGARRRTLSPVAESRNSYADIAVRRHRRHATAAQGESEQHLPICCLSAISPQNQVSFAS